MNERDLNDLKMGVLEVFTEFFSSEVYYLRLLESEANIYGEVKEKNRRYGQALRMTARPDLNPAEAQDRQDTGESQKILATFEIPLPELERTGIIEMPLTEMKRGIIHFQGVDYQILNIKPMTTVGEVFLLYLFEVGGFSGKR